MRRFEKPTDAMDHADAGGQALHVWKGKWSLQKPACFRNGEQWGHLIDRNTERLINTAQSLGVRKRKIDRKGKRGQHIDLCGTPLDKAIKWSIK